MSSNTEFVSKTQHYLKVKKPLLERQRRARMNKYLDTLKTVVAEMQGNDDILRMDKAEMLEAVLVFMRSECQKQNKQAKAAASSMKPLLPVESFRNGYMNAVNEVSRVMAATPGIDINIGKNVMTHLGFEFNRLLQTQTAPAINTAVPLTIDTNTPSSSAASSSSSSSAGSYRSVSPASSGYHSDFECSTPLASPVAEKKDKMWRPW